MIQFQKKDQIEHPVYGVGQIQNVRSANTAFSILEVDFPTAGIRKELNSQWVEKHCSHKPYVPERKPQFRDGIYKEDPTLAQGQWRVFPEQEAQGSEELREGLQYMMQKIVPGIHFVQIHKFAAVFVPQEGHTTNQQIEKAARKHMTAVFRHHPDFQCITLDDGGIAIAMEDCHLVLYMKPELVKRDKNENISLQTMLAGRMLLMAVCEDKQMYAIVRSDLPPA